MSQITESFNGVLSPGDSKFGFMVAFTRDSHLQLLTELCRHTLMFISDTVSDLTEPSLVGLNKDSEFEELLKKITAEKGFFHGTNYFTALETFKKHSDIRLKVSDYQLSGLWKWTWPNRFYLVWLVKAEMKLNESKVESENQQQQENTKDEL